MAGVQGPDPGRQKAAGLDGLVGGTVAKARGPNAAAYNEERERAKETANINSESARKAEGQSYNYTQNGPQIDNKYQGQSRQGIATNVFGQQRLAHQLANNNGEASRAQFQGNLDQSINAQMSAANSTAGGSVAQAGAARNAAAQGSLMRAQGSSEAARLGAIERQTALGQAAGVYNNIGGQLANQYGLEQGSAIQQGQLNSQNQAQQNQMRLGYGQLALGHGQLENQAAGQSTNALNSYTSADMGAQGLSAGLKGADAASTNANIGLVAGVGGGIAGGIASKLAEGGAFGRAPNSIAEVYGTRADGGAWDRVDDPNAQWARSFGSTDQAKSDVLTSDNKAEGAKIRKGFEAPAGGSAGGSAGGIAAGGIAGAFSGLSGALGSGGAKAPDWSEYMRPRARAFGGSIGALDGTVDMGGAGAMTGAMIQQAGTGRTGNAMAPVGGGGVTGGAVQGIAGPGGVGAGGALSPGQRLASTFRGF